MKWIEPLGIIVIMIVAVSGMFLMGYDLGKERGSPTIINGSSCYEFSSSIDTFHWKLVFKEGTKAFICTN